MKKITLKTILRPLVSVTLAIFATIGFFSALVVDQLSSKPLLVELIGQVQFIIAASAYKKDGYVFSPDLSIVVLPFFYYFVIAFLAVCIYVGTFWEEKKDEAAS